MVGTEREREREREERERGLVGRNTNYNEKDHRWVGEDVSLRYFASPQSPSKDGRRDREIALTLMVKQRSIMPTNTLDGSIFHLELTRKKVKGWYVCLFHSLLLS